MSLFDLANREQQAERQAVIDRYAADVGLPPRQTVDDILFWMSLLDEMQVAIVERDGRLDFEPAEAGTPGRLAELQVSGVEVREALKRKARG